MLGMKSKLDSTPSAVMAYTDIQVHLRLDGTTDQTLVEGMISAVTKRIESFIDQKLMTQVWSIFYDKFPTENADDQDAWWDGEQVGHVNSLSKSIRKLELPFGPCTSVSFIKTFDESDGTYTMDGSLYSVDYIGPRPVIALKSGNSWPSTTLRPVNGIQVQATFGMSSVPEDIKSAMKICVSRLYENRGDAIENFVFPSTALLLLDPYKNWKV